MTEPLPEAAPPDAAYPPVDPTYALERKNLLWAFALVALFVVLFAGTVVVAMVYLAVD